MKKLKGLARALYQAAASPDLRPAEVKILRALVAAAIGYLGVKYGSQA